MKELGTVAPDDFDGNEKTQLMLLVCDESSIRCTTFRNVQKSISDAGVNTVLVMPDHQYQRGLRGWVKAQIVGSVADTLVGVMPVDHETLNNELDENWAAVQVNEPIGWNKPEITTLQVKENTDLTIPETSDLFDKEMIDRTKGNIRRSNCWLDPAGCVFVRDGEVLLESVSTSFNNSRCAEIPMGFKDLSLNPDERMLFCDSLHAERMGISQAARDEVSLEESTIYVNKFPCRSCAMEIIGAGISSVVFESGSYGLADADLLIENGVELRRVKV